MPGEAAAWIHFLPIGAFGGRDGRGPYRAEDPHALIQRTVSWLQGVDMAIDYNHQFLKAEERTGPVPAAGWVKEWAAREDGVWARVDWTPAAQAALDAKEYRYFSPVFDYDARTGEVIRLKLGALTNTPNLQLQAVASREGGPMNELLERLCYMLNLPLTTTAEEMKAQLDKLKALLDQNATQAEAASRIVATLGLPAGAELAQAAQALENRLSQPPDPAQWVPKGQYDQVAQSLSSLQASHAQAETARLVREAVEAGKVAPAQEGWATAYASRDPEGFKSFVEVAPVILAPGGGSGAPPKEAAHTLTPEDEQVCQVMGLSRDAFLASKKEQA